MKTYQFINDLRELYSGHEEVELNVLSGGELIPVTSIVFDIETNSLVIEIDD